MIEVVISGPPRPQARMRSVVRKAKDGRTWAGAYEPAESRDWKAAVRLQLATEMRAKGVLPFNGPVWLHVCAVMPCPKSAHKKRTPEPRRWHSGKPDADNLVKALMDAANGGAVFHDDSQVVQLTIVKIRAAQGEHAHTIFRCGPMPPLAYERPLIITTAPDGKAQIQGTLL